MIGYIVRKSDTLRSVCVVKTIDYFSTKSAYAYKIIQVIYDIDGMTVDNNTMHPDGSIVKSLFLDERAAIRTIFK